MPGHVPKLVEEVASNLSTLPYPSIGIDIDGCADEAPIFFSLLTKYWLGKVFVISFRSDRAKAESVLAANNIRCDELILVNSFEAKARIISEKGIGVFFDDQPEALKNISPSCQVMLVRNGGNFDFDDQKWMFSKETGKLV